MRWKSISPKHISVLLINLMVLLVWSFASLNKIASGLPEWFIKLFQNTIFNTVPGLSVTFWMIVAAEFTAFMLALVSILRLEFLNKTFPFLKAALLMQLANFLMLDFGMHIVSDLEGQVRLFNYFVLSLVMFYFLDRHEKSAQVPLEK